MDSSILAARRRLLLQTQNSDGGWGYFAGKQSWMEPTFYSLLALRGDPQAEEAVGRAWRLVKSWQQADGGWRPNGSVEGATWVTALGVTLSAVEQEFGRGFENAVRWMLRATGIESAFLSRLVYRVVGRGIGRDTSNRGWPWRPDTAAWVEPTAHSLIALKKASGHFHDRELEKRIREGEQLLLSVRGHDGGWNYGSREALGVNLPSYPETTALALLGLGKQSPGDWSIPGVRPGARMAAAWRAVASQSLGKPVGFVPPEDAPADLMIAALEALALPGGNGHLLTEAR